MVDVYINYLRRKVDSGDLHDDNEALIETVRGRAIDWAGWAGRQREGFPGSPQFAAVTA